jgi:anti-sigma B factor antagonist
VNLSIQKNESYTHIKVLNKKLDSLMAPELKSALVLIIENGEKNILLDLSSCTFCDSSGLSALIFGNRLCRKIHGTFVSCGITDRVREMMDLISLDSLLLTADCKEEAEELFI